MPPARLWLNWHDSLVRDWGREVRSTFYVAEPDPIVRLDISEAIHAGFDAHHVFAEAALEPLLVQVPKANTVLIANGSLVTDRFSDHLKAYVRTGGKIILIGPPAAPDVDGILVETPFTNQMMIYAIQAAVGCVSNSHDGSSA